MPSKNRSINVLKLSLLVAMLFIGGASCMKLDLIPAPGIELNIPADSVHFVAFGDYGDGGDNERRVANLVNSLQPDFIITMGDNNYPSGKAKSLNENIGCFYCDYIYNYDAPIDQRCSGAATLEEQNRFFPSLGNHDYANRNDNTPYLNYFTLPGNEVYYDFVWGPVHFFAIDSEENRDGQREWLQNKIEESTSLYRVVYFHHSPYCSGKHGNDKGMQWGFEGVHLLLTGHDHIYERISRKNVALPLYVVNGLGGKDKRSCNEHPLDNNVFDSFCYCDDYGVVEVKANANSMNIQFINAEGELIDEQIIMP